MTAPTSSQELPLPLNAAARERSLLGGLIIFLISESMFFVALLSIRFALAGSGHPAELNEVLATVLTLVVLASVYPATLMPRAAARGDWDAVQKWAWLTLLAGLVLLAGVAWEWVSSSLTAPSRFGGIYYLTVAVHAVHVLIGVLILLSVVTRSRAHQLTIDSHFTVKAAQLFWYLVTGLWLAVWVVFYLA